MNFEDHKRFALVVTLAFLCGLIGWHRHQRREARFVAEDAALEAGVLICP